MNKKILSVLIAAACITTMAITVSADSEEFNGEEPERPSTTDTVETDTNVEDGDWEELGDSIFGDEDDNSSTGTTPAESATGTNATDASTSNTTGTTPVVTPVEVTPVTTVTTTDSTPSTGNTGVFAAVGTAIGSLAAIVGNKKRK